MKRYLLSIIFLLTLSASAFGDATVQPKIMVVPFVKENEDIRTVLEADADKRIILTKIKEAFDSRGFTTVDFLGKLKATSLQDGLSSGHQQDLKSMIIANSGADIYVDAEMIVNKTTSGNSVHVNLTAYDISTGNSLSNKVGDSGKFYSDDMGRLGSKAVESCVEDFLNIMQMKFTEMRENGTSINMRIGFAESSPFDMDSEFGNDGMTLADEIEIWMKSHAYQGNYHVQGISSKQMIIDDIKIPLKTENGSNYTPRDFGREFLKFANSLGIKIKRDFSNNTFIVTVE